MTAAVSPLRATELLYATDAYRTRFESTVVAVDPASRAIALAATAFFPTGGGQPHDVGTVRLAEADASVVDVRKGADGVVWHALADGSTLPRVEQAVEATVDWGRRYTVMRLHTAQHIMNGIIWRDHHAHVTGAQISPPEARLDFELPSISKEFAQSLENAINSVVGQDVPVRVRWLPRAEADRDPSLLRLKANLIPRTIDPLRVIDILGLDRQADGGTHVASTGEVGHVRVVRTESKGKANKRVRIRIDPA